MNLARTISYWITTILFALALGASGIGYLTGAMDPAVFELGYPKAFIVLMGALKIIGAIALLIPALPRAKEWVYAGFAFNMIGAAWSHAWIGDLGGSLPPVVLGSLLLASYLLRPESLWLGTSPWASSDEDERDLTGSAAPAK